MPEEQTQSVVNNSGQNPTEKQGVAAANSSVQAPQDVTASVNTNQQQVQNPFIVNTPAIPTQEGPKSSQLLRQRGCSIHLVIYCVSKFLTGLDSERWRIFSSTAF